MMAPCQFARNDEPITSASDSVSVSQFPTLTRQREQNVFRLEPGSVDEFDL